MVRVTLATAFHRKGRNQNPREGFNLTTRSRPLSGCGSVVAVMSRDFPAEENIFHARPLADVVHNHVAAPASFLIDDDADVRNVPTEIPGHKVPGVIVGRTGGGRENLAVALKEDHQV